jgi:threonine synthase
MRFISTRGGGEPVSFTRAMFMGLSPDGGLFCPESKADLSEFFNGLKDDVSFNDLSSGITSALLSPEISRAVAADIVRGAFTFEPRLREVTGGLHVLELFHGPSCAFKDFGASFLASAMNRLLSGGDGRAIIVTATSGDTGSAVAQAFHGKDRIDVVILYPSGRVSPLQEKQLTTLGGNVTAIEVDGSFDDCQRMAKAAFTDPALKALPLSSANSINLARLIPQSFYYVWAWTRLRARGEFAFVVPSGNFGNLTAGLYAASWGLPVKLFVAATNANDVVPEYLKTGKYTPRPSVATVSNAMDVGAPSNYERLDHLYHRDLNVFRGHVQAWSVNDRDTMETISRVDRDYGYLCCPHTAVGWKIAEAYRKKNPGIPAVVLATAHPGKFLEIVEQATGKTPVLPDALSSLMNRKKEAVFLGRTDADLSGWLRGHFS